MVFHNHHPYCTPHSTPSYWHPHVMEEETTLESLATVPIAKEAESHSPDPPTLVYSELSTQGGTNKENYHKASPELGSFLITPLIPFQGTKNRSIGTISNSLTQGRKIPVSHVTRCSPDRACESRPGDLSRVEETLLSSLLMRQMLLFPLSHYVATPNFSSCEVALSQSFYNYKN